MSMANEDRLKVAAQTGDVNLLYTLIQENPYVLEQLDSIPFIQTPLHFAAYEGHLQFATEVMRWKPSFAWKLNQLGFSPIHLAMQNDQKGMVLRFLEMDSNLVRVKGREGLTPLHLASQMGEVDLLVKFLRACPDSIEDVTMRSETALHIAIKFQKYESLKVLVRHLKRNNERGAVEMENMILNWKDEEGNTILHISALNNDLQAIMMLVETYGIDLKAKNSGNSTALDIAVSAEIKDILSNADESSSIINALIFANEKIIFPVLLVRDTISEERRSALLVVAALVATATYQTVLSPPGGVFQPNTGDNNNSSATNSPGKSVMAKVDFLSLFIINTFSFVMSILVILLLTPSGFMGRILCNMPVLMFAISYSYAMRVISPTSKIHAIIGFLVFLLIILFASLSMTKTSMFARYKAINRRNSAGVNKW